MKVILNLLVWMQGDGRRAALFLALGSAALLATAYFFQFVIKLVPCELCYLQRKPHMAIIVLGLIGFALRSGRWRMLVLGLLTLTALGNAGLSLFHVGVEYHWWTYWGSCSTPTVQPRTMEELRDLVFNSTVVPCDKPAWVLLGISMAGWNGIVCVAMAIWAGVGVRRSIST